MPLNAAKETCLACTARDLLGRHDLEQLRVECPLVKEEREPPGATLLGTVWHFCFHALSLSRVGGRDLVGTRVAEKGIQNPSPCVYNTAGQ